MFELAQFNVFTPDVKRGGARHFRLICMCGHAMGLGGMECVGGIWEWSRLWLGIMGIGSFDPSAADPGGYAGLVHGISSRPKSKPKTLVAPATGGRPRPPPPTPGTGSSRSFGAISPTLDMQRTVC